MKEKSHLRNFFILCKLNPLCSEIRIRKILRNVNFRQAPLLCKKRHYFGLQNEYQAHFLQFSCFTRLRWKLSATNLVTVDCKWWPLSLPLFLWNFLLKKRCKQIARLSGLSTIIRWRKVFFQTSELRFCFRYFFSMFFFRLLQVR